MRRKFSIKYFLYFLMFIFLLNGCIGKNEKTAKKEQINPAFIAEGIRRISIKKEDRVIFDVEYKEDNSELPYLFWKIHDPYNIPLSIDTERLLELFNKLVDLQISMKEIGNDDTTKYKEESIAEIYLEYNQLNKDKKEDSFKAEADSMTTICISRYNEKYYAYYKPDPTKLFDINSYDIESILNTKAFDIILKITPIIELSKVKQIVVERDGVKKEWTGKENHMDDVLSAFMSVFATDEYTGEYPTGELICTVDYLGYNKKDNLNVNYYSYDENSVVVVVDKKALFMANKKDLYEALKLIE